jgi:hypothetical protein
MILDAEKELQGSSLDVVVARALFSSPMDELPQTFQASLVQKAVRRVVVYRILDILLWLEIDIGPSTFPGGPAMSGKHPFDLAAVVSIAIQL